MVLGDIASFWNSEPGRKIRAHAANVRRELAFTARFSPAELAALTGVKSTSGLENEFVVVQGVADLVVLLPEEIWLVDFKTDDVRPAGLPEKTRLYAPQLKLYARALEKSMRARLPNAGCTFLPPGGRRKFNSAVRV